MSAAMNWWKHLPRAARWLIALVLFVIGYFAVFEPVLDFSRRVGADADRLELALQRERDFAGSDSGGGGDIARTIRAFGRPKAPGDLKPETFTRLVNGILEGHGVMVPNVVERRVKLSGDAAATLAATLNIGKIDRLILEVSFEADPATVVSIIAALEQAKEVAAVGRIRIDKPSGRGDEDQLVRATISPEAWIAAAESSFPSPSDQVIP